MHQIKNTYNFTIFTDKLITKFLNKKSATYTLSNIFTYQVFFSVIVIIHIFLINQNSISILQKGYRSRIPTQKSENLINYYPTICRLYF